MIYHNILVSGLKVKLSYQPHLPPHRHRSSSHQSANSTNMSDRTSSPSPQPSSTTSDIVRDTFLWRRKRLSLATLLTSTTIWVVIEVYRFSFVMLASYVAMFIVAALFLWGTMHRLLGKELQEMSRLEVSERVVVEFANTVRGWVEESIRWMFLVGAEGDWLTFAGVVASLWSMSRIGLHFDLALKDAAKARCQGLYGTLHEKVISKFSGASKTSGLEEKKEEKTE